MNEVNLSNEEPKMVFATASKKSTFKINTKGILIFCNILFIILIIAVMMRGCTPDDKVTPVPNVEGLHVMILEDTAEHIKLPMPQQGIFTSPEIVAWADENCQKYGDLTAFLKIDSEANLEQLPPIFDEMRDKMLEQNDDLPILGMMSPDGFTVERLPEDKDRTLQRLGEL